MGYAGIKIPGHTGTDFKNKKAFTASKKLLNHKKQISNVKLEQREQVDSQRIFDGIRKTVAILFIITLLVLVYLFVYRVENISIHTEQVNITNIETAEKQYAAKMLYNSAKMYYDSNALDFAQEEIILVLKLYPTNEDALTLMHKILEKQCQNKNLFCKEANDYKNYLAKHIS